MSKFASTLAAWQRRHGRRDLPWQGTRDPYRIWLSEVMLQQTQVAAVIPYYQRFLDKYPTVEALAAAQEDDVLRLWSGLGYYARGRNLLLAAREVARRGAFPNTPESIGELPGIGRSTAAAIAVFAFSRRAAILDGNVKRVLSRVFAAEGDEELWRLARRLLPRQDLETYTQALMDLGATVCARKPKCEACPVASRCIARKHGRIHELPSPRARRVLPTRRATWFVFVHDRAILLERRPSRGLWGGLWTFPETRVLRSRAGTKLPIIEHGFTHFRLLARPLVHRLRKRVESPGRLWLDLADAVHAAVPTPVRKLLLSL
ncbi:MAG: A/G-specific adenine glycosylase MutY [Burkholderiales bacterium]|nr:A/G-specific adenine glycosylase MutY [Burkholderiales bacterium]